MEEIWKDVENYEGLFQVSNFGRVRSMNKILELCDGRVRRVKGKILKTSIIRGYECITFYHNNKSKTFKVHRLVAQAFIPNPKDFPQVNHIDENKLNNLVNNLEWCTAKYNNDYSNIAERWHKTGTAASKKVVLQYDTTGKVIAEFESASEAARRIGKPHGRSSICKCCNGDLKSYNGFIWKWK